MEFRQYVFVAAMCVALNLGAQTSVYIGSPDNGIEQLSELDGKYVASKLRAHIGSCQLNNEDTASYWPENLYRYLELREADSALVRLYINANSIVTHDYRLYVMEDNRVTPYVLCDRAHILPVLAVMQDHALLNPESRGDAIRQEIIAVNEYLTSHHPNRMLARVDENDISRPYLDFEVSLKHPVLRRALDPVFDSIGFSNRNRYAQLYLAFSGRFSQYIGSRPSSPVVARRFNPELFMRFWSDDNGYWDIGYGHESNGQRITSELSFQQEQLDYIADGESPLFARDGLSRGWDYFAMAWEREWRALKENNLITKFNIRHYSNQGLFQNEPEEYNTWEDGGTKARPRNNFDGISFSAEYFLRESCSTICVQKFELTQSTGIGRPFDRNTTTLELTTDVYGLPLHIWSKSGYNNDLIDYYDYTNSWGIGLEFISR